MVKAGVPVRGGASGGPGVFAAAVDESKRQDVLRTKVESKQFEAEEAYMRLLEADAAAQVVMVSLVESMLPRCIFLLIVLN